MEVSTKRRWTRPALCIIVVMISVSTKGENLQNSKNLATVDSIGYYLNFEIMNRIYNDSLLDPESLDYKKMYSEVSTALDLVYGCSTCPTKPNYHGVKAMTFRNGSVIAESTIMFKAATTNAILVKSIFLMTVSSNSEINGLQINPHSIQDSYVTTKPPLTTFTTSATTTTLPTTTSPTTTTTTPTTTTEPTTTTPTTTDPTTTTPTTTIPTTTKPTTTTLTTTTPTITTPTTTTPTTTTPTTTTLTTTEPTTTTATTMPTTTTTTQLKTTTTTPETTSATSQQIFSSPSMIATTHPKQSSTSSSTTTTTTTTNSSTDTRSSPATHTRVTKFFFNNTSINTTEPVSITSKPLSNADEGVPGWAIALLVLAAIAILLLLIIIAILLIRWCCVDDGGDDVRSLPPQEHTPYMRTTFREPLSSVPAYSPHTPQKNLYPFDDLTQSPKPNPNRTGTYVVNPER